MNKIVETLVENKEAMKTGYILVRTAMDAVDLVNIMKKVKIRDEKDRENEIFKKDYKKWLEEAETPISLMDTFYNDSYRLVDMHDFKKGIQYKLLMMRIVDGEKEFEKGKEELIKMVEESMIIDKIVTDSEKERVEELRKEMRIEMKEKIKQKKKEEKQKQKEAKQNKKEQKKMRKKVVK